MASNLGRAHRRRKAQLPNPNGSPCPRCGEPMWTWQKLDAGHSIDRVLGGLYSALRWEHAKCNRSDGASLGNRLRGKAKAVKRNAQRWA